MAVGAWAMPPESESAAISVCTALLSGTRAFIFKSQQKRECVRAVGLATWVSSSVQPPTSSYGEKAQTPDSLATQGPVQTRPGAGPCSASGLEANWLV